MLQCRGGSKKNGSKIVSWGLIETEDCSSFLKQVGSIGTTTMCQVIQYICQTLKLPTYVHSVQNFNSSKKFLFKSGLCRNSPQDIFGSVYVYASFVGSVTLCSICTPTIRSFKICRSVLRLMIPFFLHIPYFLIRYSTKCMLAKIAIFLEIRPPN